jgi:predicted YcjX-like family ATPase
MFAVIASLLGVLIGGLLPYITNKQIHKHDIDKLKLEHNKEVKVFTREKYEQLIIKLYRLAYMAYEGVYYRSRNGNLNFTMETFMMLMAEVDTLVMLHFPLLEEDYEKFSKQLVKLYIELFAGSFEQCRVIKEDFDREADNLLKVVKRHANEYTQIVTS